MDVRPAAQYSMSAAFVRTCLFAPDNLKRAVSIRTVHYSSGQCQIHSDSAVQTTEAIVDRLEQGYFCERGGRVGTNPLAATYSAVCLVGTLRRVRNQPCDFVPQYGRRPHHVSPGHLLQARRQRFCKQQGTHTHNTPTSHPQSASSCYFHSRFQASC